MDRPMGPRQPPPDRRHTAYESIFDAPGANHHVSPAGLPAQYPHPPPPQHSQQYPYSPQQYPNLVDNRAAHNNPYFPKNFSSPQVPHYPQTFYTPVPPTSFQQQPYAQYAQYNYSQPIQNGQNSTLRTRSMVAHSQVPGGSRPPLDELPDHAPNGFHQQVHPPSLYQTTKHASLSNGTSDEWSRQRPIGVLDRHSYPQAHTTSSFHGQEPPRVCINVEGEEGRFGIELKGTLNGNESDQGTDEDSSELPWVRNDSASITKRGSRTNSGTGLQSTTQPAPLRIDATSSQASSSMITPASTISTHTDQLSTLVDQNTTASRRSSDSSRTMARYSINSRRDRAPQDRASSAPVTPATVRTSLDTRASPRPIIPTGRDSPSVRPRKTPVVYPALLSRVAEAFRDRITLTDRHKDGLIYKSAFDGREAVDKIAYIIKTTDRNLALLLGRALDAQKFFHDVTYDHRLRDNSNEIYQFRTKIRSPFVSGELHNGSASKNSKEAQLPNEKDFETEGNTGRPRPGSVNSDDIPLPSGVFTLLTDCYSPTCSRVQLCYSIACPRRLEQQARLNMRPQPGLSSKVSKESLIDVSLEPGMLWVHSVPPEIVNSVSEKEKKRQEAINEVIYTERDFVRDVEYMRDVWVNRLKEDDCIPPDRRVDFIQQVFWNTNEIIAVNTKLRDALIKRQKSYAVVERIGDVLLEYIPQFGPFVKYGSHQLYGKFQFEKEKNSNPAFAQFVETTERLPESRKLELNAYLTKPTTRLARYPLLLGAVLKHTPEDSPDKVMLSQATSLIREILERVNAESGRTENRFNLIQLEQQLVFKPGEEVDLRLKEEGREMVYKNVLNKRDGELQVYLFDHALLFTKNIKNKQHEHFKVYRRPIPLELLSFAASEDVTLPQARLRNRNTLVSRSSPAAAHARVEAKGQYWIHFTHLGRKEYSLLLWANSAISQKKWVESIEKQQQLMRDRSNIFEARILSDGFFVGGNAVKCAAPFQNGRKIVYGTADGIYLSEIQDINRDPVKVVAILDVTQVDVLEEYQLLVVLAERQVHTFPLDALNPMDPMAPLRRAKTISSHTSFFKAGYCLGRTLVCIVKSSALSSTFKTLEPIDQNVRNRSKPTFRKLLQGGNDTLSLFREFYLPVESTSVHYLRTKMCVGCSRGFEIVDLETLDTQGLLDPFDESLDFVRRREDLRPMAIYRVGNEFLLCYDLAFYVNRSGKRARREFVIYWEGRPTGFAFHEPYVFAFEPTFVEIRNIDTGLMAQVIQGTNIRLLFADAPPSAANSTPVHHQPPYPPPFGQAPYQQQPSPYGNRGSPFNVYPPPTPGTPYQPPTSQSSPPPSLRRDEIIMVSDDRVCALRLSPLGQRLAMPGDNVSIISSSTR